MTGSNSSSFSDILNQDIDLMIHMGNLFYSGITVNDINL